MTRLNPVLFLLVFVALSGCAVYRPLSPGEIGTLGGNAFPRQGESLSIRQAVTINREGQALDFETALSIDAAKREVRAVGLGEMGVKYFETSVGEKRHYLKRHAVDFDRIRAEAGLVNTLRFLYVVAFPRHVERAFQSDELLTVETESVMGLIRWTFTSGGRTLLYKESSEHGIKAAFGPLVNGAPESIKVQLKSINLTLEARTLEARPPDPPQIDQTPPPGPSRQAPQKPARRR